MVQRTYLRRCYQTRMCGSLFWWTVIIAHGRNNAVGRSRFVRLGIAGSLVRVSPQAKSVGFVLGHFTYTHETETKKKNTLKPIRLAFEKKA